MLPEAGALSGGAGYTSISVGVKLTEKGARDWQTVVAHVKGYIEFLKSQPLPEFLNQEVGQMDLAYKLEEDYGDVSISQVSGLNYRYFSGGERPKNWTELFVGKSYPDVTEEEYFDFLSRVDYSEALVTLSTPEHQEVDVTFQHLGDMETGGVAVKKIDGRNVIVDNIFKFAYPMEDLDLSSLPPEGTFVGMAPNPYVPQDLSKVDADIEQPPLYTAIEGPWGLMRYNYLVDTILPKTYLSLKIHSDKIDFSKPKNTAALFVVREILRRRTQQTFYPMASIGFSFSLGILVNSGSMDLSLSGWSDTFDMALSDVMSQMTLDISEEEFLTIRDDYKQSIMRIQESDPSASLRRGFLSRMTPAYLDFEDLYPQLDALSLEDITAFTKNFASGITLHGSLTGNTRPEQVDFIVSTLQKNWGVTWGAKTKP